MKNHCSVDSSCQIIFFFSQLTVVESTVQVQMRQMIILFCQQDLMFKVKAHEN